MSSNEVLDLVSAAASLFTLLWELLMYFAVKFLVDPLSLETCMLHCWNSSSRIANKQNDAAKVTEILMSVLEIRKPNVKSFLRFAWDL